MKKIEKNTKKDINIKPMKSDNTHVAVYGTLRDGTGLLGTITGGRLVFPGHTYYPAWIRDKKSKKKTVVEVHAVSDEKLRALDQYEGSSSGLYSRTKIKVKLEPQSLMNFDEGMHLDCWIYEAGELMMERYGEKFTLVPEGDWNGEKAIYMRRGKDTDAKYV